MNTIKQVRRVATLGLLLTNSLGISVLVFFIALNIGSKFSAMNREMILVLASGCLLFGFTVALVLGDLMKRLIIRTR